MAQASWCPGPPSAGPWLSGKQALHLPRGSCGHHKAPEGRDAESISMSGKWDLSQGHRFWLGWAPATAHSQSWRRQSVILQTSLRILPSTGLRWRYQGAGGKIWRGNPAFFWLGEGGSHAEQSTKKFKGYGTLERGASRTEVIRVHISARRSWKSSVLVCFIAMMTHLK